MKIDQRSAPSGIFAARASASVTTVDRCPGPSETLPTANTAVAASDRSVPSDGGKSSAEAPADAAAVAENATLATSTSQGEDSIEITSPTVPAPCRLAAPRLRLFFRLRASFPPERADEQPLPQALHHPLLTRRRFSTICPACYKPAATSTATTGSGRRDASLMISTSDWRTVRTTDFQYLRTALFARRLGKLTTLTVAHDGMTFCLTPTLRVSE